MTNILHVLNTDTKMSPLRPFENQYAEHGLVAYVLSHIHSGNKRIVTSWGHLGADVGIGQTVLLVGDQSGRRIGEHRVVAIIDFSTGVRYKAKTTEWRNLNAKLKHYVVK